MRHDDAAVLIQNWICKRVTFSIVKEIVYAT